MKVSIITIAWNSEETIEDTIKSVLEQTYDNVEYIIIDGKSTDSTMDIVAKYQDKISVVISEEDKGLYDAMNKGVKKATGDLIGILNSDDIYSDNEVVSDIVSSLNGADGIYADLVYVNREDTDKVVRYWKSGKYVSGAFNKGWMPPHPTFFVRRECYDRFGCFNLQLRSAADYEIMLRMIHKGGISLSYLPRVITKMRVGGQSNLSLKNRLKANKEDRMAWRINGLKPSPLMAIRKPARKIIQFIKKG